MIKVPQSLAVVPNIPHSDQTIEQLREEWAYWDEMVRTATGPASAVAADGFRRSCHSWIVVREGCRYENLPNDRMWQASMAAAGPFDDVRQFHRKFGLDHHPDKVPNLLSPSDLDFRVRFLREEIDEFETACDENNIEDAADALADLVYVAMGTAHLMGIPFDNVWAEVQRANMSKERATGADDTRSKRKHVLDVVKPAGFRPPDHRLAIEKARQHALAKTTEGSAGQRDPGGRVGELGRT